MRFGCDACPSPCALALSRLFQEKSDVDVPNAFHPRPDSKRIETQGNSI